MLTALPFFETAPDHDTESDLDREDLVARARATRRPREEREVAQVFEITALPPPKRPIPKAEQMTAACVTRLQVREAVVKRMQASKKEPKPEPAFRVPDVRIDWVRGCKSLRVTREGADGFTIEGAAAENSRISVGIEGLIFSVAVAPGDSAASALDRLVRRLNLGYQVEVLEQTPTRSTARLASHT